MNLIDIHRKILDLLIDKAQLSKNNAKNIRTPKDMADLVSNIMCQVSSIDGDLLAQIIADIAEVKLVLPKNAKKASHIDQESFIVDNVLYLVNPFNERIKQQKLQLKKQGLITFNKIGIVASDHPLLTKITVANTDKTDDDNDNEILLIWQNILKQIRKIEPADIHFMPEGDYTRVFFRRHSNLLITLDLEQNKYKKLVNVLFGLAGINSASFALPQQGKLIEKGIEFRLQSIQTNHTFSDGALIPKITLRAHYHHHKILNLDKVGLIKQQEDILTTIVASINSGSVIIAGPTGSGKTTLLYSLLNKMQTINQNQVIHTLEDPVEVNVASIIQSPINKKANMDYKDAIPVLLRSDIDVALISEIRDANTAQKALEIALTGHIAFSTIHTSDALSIIVRLEKSFGIKRDMMASTLDTLIAQRLLRKVCNSCSITNNLTTTNSYIANKYINMGLDNNSKIQFVSDKGCAACHWTGYSGVVPILEIMKLDTQAKKMISNDDDVFTIRNYLSNIDENNYYLNTSLMQSGINALLLGLISLEELEKIPIGNFDIPQDLLQQGENYAKYAKQ